MHLLYTLADAMLWVIFVTVAWEASLFVARWRVCRGLECALKDSLQNMVKGTLEFPDRDSCRDIHDEVDVLLDCVEAAERQDIELTARLADTIRAQDERKVDMRTYRMECIGNVATAVVQVFPLLGILGTVLGLGASLQGGDGTAGVERIVGAFATAIDTTILGLSAAVVFMVVDALAQARISRLRRALVRYRDVTRLARELSATNQRLEAEAGP